MERRRRAQGHAEGDHRHHEQGDARGAGDAGLKAQFEKVGVEAHATTPDELMDAAHRSDIKKWDAVIDKAGMPKK